MSGSIRYITSSFKSNRAPERNKALESLKEFIETRRHKFVRSEHDFQDRDDENISPDDWRQLMNAFYDYCEDTKPHHVTKWKEGNSRSEKILKNIAEVFKLFIVYTSKVLPELVTNSTVYHVMFMIRSNQNEGIIQPLGTSYLAGLSTALDEPRIMRQLEDRAWQTLLGECTNSLDFNQEEGLESSQQQSKSANRPHLASFSRIFLNCLLYYHENDILQAADRLRGFFKSYFQGYERNQIFHDAVFQAFVKWLSVMKTSELEQNISVIHYSALKALSWWDIRSPSMKASLISSIRIAIRVSHQYPKKTTEFPPIIRSFSAQIWSELSEKKIGILPTDLWTRVCRDHIVADEILSGAHLLPFNTLLLLGDIIFFSDPTEPSSRSSSVDLESRPSKRQRRISMHENFLASLSANSHLLLHVLQSLALVVSIHPTVVRLNHELMSEIFARLTDLAQHKLPSDTSAHVYFTLSMILEYYRPPQDAFTRVWDMFDATHDFPLSVTYFWTFVETLIRVGGKQSCIRSFSLIKHLWDSISKNEDWTWTTSIVSLVALCYRMVPTHLEDDLILFVHSVIPRLLTHPSLSEFPNLRNCLYNEKHRSDSTNKLVRYTVAESCQHYADFIRSMQLLDQYIQFSADSFHQLLPSTCLTSREDDKDGDLQLKLTYFQLFLRRECEKLLAANPQSSMVFEIYCLCFILNIPTVNVRVQLTKKGSLSKLAQCLSDSTYVIGEDTLSCDDIRVILVNALGEWARVAKDQPAPGWPAQLSRWCCRILFVQRKYPLEDNLWDPFQKNLCDLTDLQSYARNAEDLLYYYQEFQELFHKDFVYRVLDIWMERLNDFGYKHDPSTWSNVLKVLDIFFRKVDVVEDEETEDMVLELFEFFWKKRSQLSSECKSCLFNLLISLMKHEVQFLSKSGISNPHAAFIEMLEHVDFSISMENIYEGIKLLAVKCKPEDLVIHFSSLYRLMTSDLIDQEPSKALSYVIIISAVASYWPIPIGHPVSLLLIVGSFFPTWVEPALYFLARRFRLTDTIDLIRVSMSIAVQDIKKWRNYSLVVNVMALTCDVDTPPAVFIEMFPDEYLAEAIRMCDEEFLKSTVLSCVPQASLLSGSFARAYFVAMDEDLGKKRDYCVKFLRQWVDSFDNFAIQTKRTASRVIVMALLSATQSQIHGQPWQEIEQELVQIPALETSIPPNTSDKGGTNTFEIIHRVVQDYGAQDLAPFFMPQRINRILHSVHGELSKLIQFPAQLLICLNNGYRIMLALSKNTISHPYLFRSVLERLLEFCRVPQVTDVCCYLLNYVICRALKCETKPCNLIEMIYKMIAVLSGMASGHDEISGKNIVTVTLSQLIDQAKTLSHIDMCVARCFLDPEMTCELFRSMSTSPPSCETFLAALKYAGDENSSIVVANLRRCLQEMTLDLTEMKCAPNLVDHLKSLPFYSEDVRYCVALLSLTGASQKSSIRKVGEVRPPKTALLSTLYEYHFVSDASLRNMLNRTFFEIAEAFLSDEEVMTISSPEIRACLQLFGAGRRQMKKSSQAADVSPLDLRTFYKDRDSFVTQLTLSVVKQLSLANPVFQSFTYLAGASDQLCETILPFLVHILLEKELDRPDQTGFRIELSATLNTVLTLSSEERDDSLLPVVLNLIQYFEEIPLQTASTLSRWLQVDYNHVSKASFSCNRYTETVYFAEKWFAFHQSAATTSQIAQMSKMMLESFKRMGERDSCQGLMAFLMNKGILLDNLFSDRYLHEQKWLPYAVEVDNQLPTGASSKFEVLSNLCRMGLYHTAEIFSKGLSSSHSNSITLFGGTETADDDIQYRILWEMGKWDLDTSNMASCDKHGGYSSLYYMHRLLENTNPVDCFGLNERIRSLIKSKNKAVNPLFLDDGIDIALIESKEMGLMISQKISVENLHIRWDQRQNYFSHMPFDYVGLLLSNRINALSVVSEQYPSPSKLHDLLLNSAALKFKMALHALNLSSARDASLLLEKLMPAEYPPVLKAKIFHAQKETQMAISILQSWLHKHQTSSDVHSEVLYYLGRWHSELRSELPQNLIRDYFLPAIQHVSPSQGSLVGKLHYRLAQYCFTVLDTLRNDEHLLQLERSFNEREEHFKAFRSKAKKEDKVFVVKMERELNLDKQELQFRLKEVSTYLLLCLEHYLKTLVYSDKKSENCVFRLCSLWFQYAYREDVNVLIETHVKQIPSMKFLPLMYQLSARLSVTTDPTESGFQKTLKKVICKIVLDYPHHSLHHLLALKSGSETYAQDVRAGNHAAATEIIGELMRHSGLAVVISESEKLFHMYTEVANLQIPKAAASKPKHDFSRNMAISRYEGSSYVSPLTVTWNPRESCKMEADVYPVKFKRSFSLPGGINVPKVVECVLSNGVHIKQLVKGNDDLRQDAVLSSVFRLVDLVLKRQKSRTFTNLSVRTYLIIPLSPRVGVVEWVEGTAPLRVLLEKAHIRHWPDDWPAQSCRVKMMNEHKRVGSTLQSKLDVYKTIEEHFHPAFSRLLFDTYRNSTEWFQTQKAFTRSVATNSITGFLVGLGDRHSMNILLDTTTGELIHIDLGIAFDQGKLLSMPEMVPFRLTRDIVDGFGVCGLDGMFRKVCEHTLSTLKSNADLVLTLIEVLKYDPLYSWKVSPIKMRRARRDEEEMTGTNMKGLTNGNRDLWNMVRPKEFENSDKNEQAERALLGVRKKLFSPLSVECQVSELINEATDTSNLCRMFPGWQPWL